MVKKAAEYFRRNIWVVILWLVAVLLSIYGANSKELEKIPDVIFVCVVVVATVLIAIDFTRYEMKTGKNSHMKVTYKRKGIEEIYNKVYDSVMKNDDAKGLLTKKWTESIGTALHYFMEYHECEKITDHEIVACSIFALTDASDTREAYEALYFAFRDMISKPMVYSVDVAGFYDATEFMEIGMMPVKNLAIIEARKGDSIVDEIAEIAGNPKTMDKLDQLVTYIKELYDAAKNTTEY